VWCTGWVQKMLHLHYGYISSTWSMTFCITGLYSFSLTVVTLRILVICLAFSVYVSILCAHCLKRLGIRRNKVENYNVFLGTAFIIMWCNAQHSAVCIVWCTIISFLLCVSLRRNADDLRKSLESVVVPLFCISQLAVDEEKQTKLAKVSVFCYC